MADIVPTRRPPARLAAFVLALAPLAACSFIADPSGARNDPRDAGASTDSGAMEVDAGSDGGMSCALRSIPTAPTDVDDSDPEGLVVTLFAARDIALDSEVVAWEGYSWDLDGNCETSCDNGGGFIIVDGEQGQDNVFGGNILPLVEALGQSGPAPQPIERWAQQNEDFGVNVPVIEIRGWDQVSRNDPSVTVSVVIAGGVEGGNARWNGADRMIPYEDSIGAMGEIAVRDDAAYIIDGLLVARVPRNFFPISLGDELPSFKVSFTDGYLLAEIGEGILGLDRIVFTGRWREADLVSALARVGECIPGGDTLPPGLLSPTQYLDLATTPTGDGVPGVSCGALSAAIMFRRGTPIDEILLARPIAFTDGCE